MTATISDYKAWIQERAEDIVFNLWVEPFGNDFYEEWERHKDWAYKVAIEDYKNVYARRCRHCHIIRQDWLTKESSTDGVPNVSKS